MMFGHNQIQNEQSTYPTTTASGYIRNVLKPLKYTNYGKSVTTPISQCTASGSGFGSKFGCSGQVISGLETVPQSQSLSFPNKNKDFGQHLIPDQPKTKMFGSATSGIFSKPTTTSPVFPTNSMSTFSQSHNTFGSSMFGAQTPSSSGNVFGSSVGPKSTSPSFSYNPSSNVFGPNTSSVYKPTTISSNPFGILKLGPKQEGTGHVKFKAGESSEIVLKCGINHNIKVRYQSIAMMKEYEDYSYEELQWADYQANRKGPQNSLGGYNKMYSSMGSSNSMFGEPEPTKPIVSSSSWTNTSSFGFGHSAKSNLFSKPLTTTFGLSSQANNTSSFNTFSSTNLSRSTAPTKPFSTLPMSTNNLFSSNLQQQNYGSAAFSSNGFKPSPFQITPKPNVGFGSKTPEFQTFGQSTLDAPKTTSSFGFGMNASPKSFLAPSVQAQSPFSMNMNQTVFQPQVQTTAAPFSQNNFQSCFKNNFGAANTFQPNPNSFQTPFIATSIPPTQNQNMPVYSETPEQYLHRTRQFIQYFDFYEPNSALQGLTPLKSSEVHYSTNPKDIKAIMNSTPTNITHTTKKLTVMTPKAHLCDDLDRQNQHSFRPRKNVRCLHLKQSSESDDNSDEKIFRSLSKSLSDTVPKNGESLVEQRSKKTKHNVEQPVTADEQRNNHCSNSHKRKASFGGCDNNQQPNIFNNIDDNGIEFYTANEGFSTSTSTRQSSDSCDLINGETHVINSQGKTYIVQEVNDLQSDLACDEMQNKPQDKEMSREQHPEKLSRIQKILENMQERINSGNVKATNLSDGKGSNEDNNNVKTSNLVSRHVQKDMPNEILVDKEIQVSQEHENMTQTFQDTSTDEGISSNLYTLTSSSTDQSLSFDLLDAKPLHVRPNMDVKLRTYSMSDNSNTLNQREVMKKRAFNRRHSFDLVNILNSSDTGSVDQIDHLCSIHDRAGDTCSSKTTESKETKRVDTSDEDSDLLFQDAVDNPELLINSDACDNDTFTTAFRKNNNFNKNLLVMSASDSHVTSSVMTSLETSQFLHEQKVGRYKSAQHLTTLKDCCKRKGLRKNTDFEQFILRSHNILLPKDSSLGNNKFNEDSSKVKEPVKNQDEVIEKLYLSGNFDENQEASEIKNNNQSSDSNDSSDCKVKLARPDYYMIPPIKHLSKYKNNEGRIIIKGLTIGRLGYGNIYFPHTTDITDLDLDELILFEYRSLTVYPDDEKKPQVGKELNCFAQITIDNVYPVNKNTASEMTADELKEFVPKLRTMTEKMGGIFVDYRSETGSWVFTVNHF